MKICILTAGKGSRMKEFSMFINKSLLPFENKAIISHIIEFFSPDDEFIIATGYLGNQVKEYLNAAHPDRTIRFVDIKNHDGIGSGPGLSLLNCKSFLQEPFFYTPCDCILKGNLKNLPQNNWIGIQPRDPTESVNYCNIAIKNNKVIDIRDKEECGDDYFAFTAPLYVHNFATFWNSLEDKNMIHGEHQISNGIRGLMHKHGLYGVSMPWINLGDKEKYLAALKKENFYNFSKPDEFIYFINNRVIKFFSDKSIVIKRIKKALLNPSAFPQVFLNGEQFYYYQFFPGQTFYSCGTTELFSNLLDWLEKKLWLPVQIEPTKMQKLCYEFYYNKTKERFDLFCKNNPNYIFPSKINGKKVYTISEILNKIPWQIICSGIPTFIHGDLNFGNILYDEKSKRFLLIDWRQDFAGSLEFGDIYYDFAKLMAGILVNYEYVKEGLFHIKEINNNVILDIKKWNATVKYQTILDNFLSSRKFNLTKTHLLAGLSYINMAPLHQPPFNFALMALASLILTQELDNLNDNHLKNNINN